MSEPKSPPPGSMPGLGSPDVSDMMDQMMQSGQGGQPGDSSATGGMPGGLPGMPGGQGASQPPKNARAIGNPVQEAKYLGGDIGKGLVGLLPDTMQKVLGVTPQDSEKEAQRKMTMLKRYQEMNAEQQNYVNMKMKKQNEEKQRREEEERARKQQAEAQRSQDVSVPQGKTRGEGGPGASKKQNAMAKLQNDRKKPVSAG